MYAVRSVGKGDVLRTARAQIADSAEYAYGAEACDSDEDDLGCRCPEEA
jgi:hypothetical protein